MSENVTYCVTTVVEFIDEFIRAKTAMQRLTEIIDTKTEVEGDTQKAWVRIPEQADITFHNIIFHYVGRINLLENFSLHIPGGKTTAIIGESGCGKSTIAKLIAGLYPLQPQNREYNNSGQIFLGNYSLQDLSLDCLRQQVILVPQEAHFWSRTIIDNFRLGNPELTDQQIFYYCALTNAHSFISKLPSSYQTVLGEFGTNISGGQRQRLAIAKALAAEPAILILDESTSSLDPQSEAEVLARILEVRKGKTTILISHRERVFLQADWIIQLQNGQLAQAGEPSLFNTLSYLTH
jgi:ATP-binding cassette subfamily C protein